VLSWKRKDVLLGMMWGIGSRMTAFIANVFLLAECCYIYKGTNHNCSDLATVWIVVNLQK
jgi:hypothetical protein